MGKAIPLTTFERLANDPVATYIMGIAIGFAIGYYAVPPVVRYVSRPVFVPVPVETPEPKT